MKYINQKRYKHIPYPTHVNDPDHAPRLDSTIASSGCGICSACMMIDQLTTKSISVEDCMQISFDTKANSFSGTRMRMMGPEIARRFNLDYNRSDDINVAVDALNNGACVIICVGGDHDDHIGVFSHGGHYICAIGMHKGKICILDPSQLKHKYDEPLKKGLVEIDEHFIYADPSVVADDCTNREGPFYIFSRK